MTSPIRIGIVGLGRAGWGMHCPELQGREDKFRIVAACDLIPERRQRMAERYGCATYERIEDLVADPDVELVDIATRSRDHFAHGMLALEAGKHVQMEKPMCVSYDQARRLVEASERSAGRLYVRHNRRFDPEFLQIREIIDSGLLGNVFEIRLVRYGYQRRDDWQTLKSFGGGLLLNWGPHIVDHALRFLDGQVVDQFSFLERVAAVGDAEDHLKIVLRGAQGRVVDLEISGGVASESPVYLVFGSRGSLEMVCEELHLRYLDPQQKLEARFPNPGTPGESYGEPEALVWVNETIPVRQGSGAVIWDALYAAIREGVPHPVRLDEALQVMQVISAAKEGTEFVTP